MEDLEYKLFFAYLRTFGGAVMKRLLYIYGNEKNIFNLSEKELASQKLSANQIAEFVRFKKIYNSERYLNYFHKNKMKLTTVSMPDYPERLKNIPNKPYNLFYFGSLPSDIEKCVAIIGTRQCSDYGRRIALDFSGILADNGIQIISGMAQGIDGIAGNTAIEHGGKSYAILGSGIDICYPYSNKGLYEKLIEKGGVISEFAPGTQPKAMNFPVRNRIISGLSDLVLVIEAREKSGTAITVSMALEQGRDVYAVPGRVDDILSEGCNKMITEGAGVAYSTQPILEALNIRNTVTSHVSEAAFTKDSAHDLQIKRYSELCESPLEERIVSIVGNCERGVQYICDSIPDEPIEIIQASLFNMEMNGVLINTVGHYRLK